jgi:hypothetical protein
MDINDLVEYNELFGELNNVQRSACSWSQHINFKDRQTTCTHQSKPASGYYSNLCIFQVITMRSTYTTQKKKKKKNSRFLDGFKAFRN